MATKIKSCLHLKTIITSNYLKNNTSESISISNMRLRSKFHYHYSLVDIITEKYLKTEKKI